MSELTRRSGLGRVLIAIYAVLALAATGRSFFQLVTKFEEAPLAYSLSTLSALVYILATIALIARGYTWYIIAYITIAFELVGVLVVGAISMMIPSMFPDDTVWSNFGAGYLFIPLVIPVLGLIWLRQRPEVRAS